MFVDQPGGGPSGPPEPFRPRPRVSARDERILIWLFCILALGLLLAPIAGGTVIAALAALFR